ncbi:MAG: hypothetical protein LQ341_007006 [Variospora aurantia]|nr:MAG: hypothetical protein LQ341_007006 [Variospora aurantia]
MAILKDVEVRVVTKANKQQLTEYDKPNAVVAAAGDDSIEKYVEAKTGEDFQVEVYFKKSFDCFDAWGISVDINFDGGVVSFAEMYSKREIRKQQDAEEAVIFDSVYHREGSLCSDVGFRFGSLNLGKSWTLSSLITLTLNADENMDSSKDTLEAQAVNLGVISIKIVRVNRELLPKPMEIRGFYKPLASVDVSKELIKKEHISNVMQPGEKTRTKTMGLQYYKYKTYKGKNCGFSVFKFRYRSKMHLQLLGCISGSPSPTGPDVTNEEVSVMPAGVVPAPAVDASAPVAVKDESETSAEGNSIPSFPNTGPNTGLNDMAARIQILEQQLKESQEKQAAMMQKLMGGISTAIRSAFAAPETSAASNSRVVKREKMKEEDVDRTAGQTSPGASRPAKRAKIVIELD